VGRLDLPDVHRDEDDFYGSPVDSPLMAREAGDSIVLRATGEPQSDAWAESKGREFELMIPETRRVVRAGFVYRRDAEEAAMAYHDDVGVRVVVVENWRG
jgi:hypothetical protein